MSFADGIKTIVVATDLDGRSDAALEYARKLASAYGARIVLAYGLDPLDYAAVDTVPESVLASLSARAQAALERMTAELIREGIASHSEIRQGAIAQMLVDLANQYQAGLIVIGTEGAEGAGPVVVGAVAEQLVRMASCPVLAVAADWNAGAFRPTPGGPVLLAIERNQATAASVAAAASLAASFKRPLLVLHASAGSVPDPCAATQQQFCAELSVAASSDFPIQCVVKEGSPAEAVTAAIADFKPCILVTGVKRESQTPGSHGTAFTLLASSRVPVLCVPPDAAPIGREQEARIPVEA